MKTNSNKQTKAGLQNKMKRLQGKSDVLGFDQKCIF